MAQASPPLSIFRALLRNAFIIARFATAPAGNPCRFLDDIFLID